MTTLPQFYRTSIDGYIAKHKLSYGLQIAANPIAPTRVKHRTISQKRRNAGFSDSETPERSVNKGHLRPIITADAPHIAPLILSSKPMAENCRLSPSVWEKPARLGGLFGPLWKTFQHGELA